MRRLLGAGLAALVVSGCAYSSEVMPGDNGTYFISSHAPAIRGGVIGANETAYSDANAFCSQHGARAIIISTNGGDEADNGNGNTSLHFRCQ
jgi:hypothetical protein